MTNRPVDIVRRLLENRTNDEIVRKLVTDDAVYISLNFENSELKTLLPWVGTTQGPRAADAIIDMFSSASFYWDVEDFVITDIFGVGDHVAAFGRLSYRSGTLGKLATSPFAVHAKVTDGQVSYLQFFEDTYATASTFRARGSWYVHSDPEGKGFDFGT
ncbi:nuclear transport factor 2 family protein [Roseomonas sp. WA12]